MAYPGSDRRKHKRIEEKFMARVRVNKDARWEIVVLKNLSASGTLFLYGQRLKIGSLVELRINFPFYQKSIIATVARTVRVESQAHASLFRVAVEFTEIGKDEQSSIDKAANDLLPEDPKRP